MNSIYVAIEGCKKQHQALTHLIHSILLERTCHLKPWDTELTTLFELFLKHARMEDEVLIPMVREVFSFKEKIGDYLQGEHDKLTDRLQRLLSDFDAQNLSRDQLCEFMEDLLVHIYQEEQLLYPLVEQYLQKNCLPQTKLGDNL